MRGLQGLSGVRPTGDGGFVARLLLFLGVSVLCGLLVAGVALPVLGGLGLAARDSANGFESLPDELQIPPLPERTRILAADGSLIATFYDENRISVPLSDVAPVMRKSVVAIEDSRFYDHGGIDLRGTMRALVNNQSGKDVQGGSTLTQQYVKQVLLESASNIADPKKRAEAEKAAVAQSYTRKLRELRYAVALEEKYTKQQILERYLNIAYFGAGAYGVEAAAKRYFNTHARDLTLPQAALLAGIVQQPTAFDPTRNPDRALARRNVVLARMAQVGLASQADVTAAQATGLELRVPKRQGNGCNDSRVPFFCDFVLKTILNNKTFGATRDERRRLLLRGGLTITHDAGPPRAGRGPAVAGRPREPPRQGRVRAGVGAAGHRPDQGDGRQPRLRGRQGRDQVQPGHRPGVRRQQRVPGGLDVQAVRRGRGPRAGLPVQLLDLRAVPGAHRGREGLRRHPHRQVGPVQRDTQRERHLHAGDRHRGVHQHLLRPARGAGRGLPALADRGVARHEPRRRQEAGRPVQDLHARRRRGVAAVDGRGLRDVRRPWPALQLDPDPRGDRPGRQAAAGARRPTASRRSTRRSPTASTSCCKASSPTAPASAPPSAGPQPARPAPPTRGSRSGSSATPPTSPPPCGPATRARRPAATR